MEGLIEKAAEDFVKQTIKGTEWEGKVYAVGGYVRDLVRGADAKDLDIVVDAPNGGITFAEWITKKIGAYKPDSNPVIFPKFLTAQFRLTGITHNGQDLSDYKLESVAPRAEVYNDPNSRKPEVVQTDLKGDASRRDLSINALYKNISTGQILDPSGMGLDDLKNKVLKPAGDPDKIYQEDALRLLRIVRFYAKMGYSIPGNILRSVKRNAPRLESISEERIQEELNKMLMTTEPEKAIKLLKVTGLLDYVIPEFKAAYRMQQNKFHHRDVFGHTLDVLSNTQPVLVQRLMGLFHDIGKTVTKSVTPTGVHFYGHEMAGEKITKDVMRRLKYPNELIDAVATGVRNHMRLKSGKDDAVSLSDKTLRKFKVEIGDELENVLGVIHADNISHADAHSMPNQVNNIKKRLDALNIEKTTTGKLKLPISGDDLKAMGIKPGPIYGKIMSSVTEKWYENPNLTVQQALQIAKSIAGSQPK